MKDFLHNVKCMTAVCKSPTSLMFKEIECQTTKERESFPIHINICPNCLPTFMVNMRNKLQKKTAYLPVFLKTTDNIELNIEDVKKPLTSVKTEVKQINIVYPSYDIFSKDLDVRSSEREKRNTHDKYSVVLHKIFNRLKGEKNKTQFKTLLEHFNNYHNAATAHQAESYEQFADIKWAYNLLKIDKHKRRANQKKDTCILRGYNLVISSPRYMNIVEELTKYLHITIEGRKLVINRAGLMHELDIFLSVMKKYSILIEDSVLKNLHKKHKQFKIDSSSLNIQKDIRKEEYIKEYNLLKKLSFENKEENFTMKLFDYQAQDISAGQGKRYLFNTGQMGIGKNLYGYMFALRQSEGRSLIMMPANNLKDPWQNNIDTLLPNKKVLTIRKGRDAYKILTEEYDVLLVPTSIVTNPAIFHFLKKQSFEKFVLDESHNQKATTSNASKKIERIVRDIKYRYLLSGTPVKKDNNDLYQQFLILFGRGPMMINRCKYEYTYDSYSGKSENANTEFGKIFNKSSFKRAFSPQSIAVFDTKNLVEAPNKDMLDEIFKGVRIRRTSQEAFLAMCNIYGGTLLENPLTIKKVDLNFTESELSNYESLAEEEYHELLKRFAWHENPKRMAKGQLCHYLRRVISHPWTYKGFHNTHPKEFMKIQWIINSVKKFIQEGKKVIIGTNHSETFHILNEILEKELFVDELEPQRFFPRNPKLSMDKRDSVVKKFRSTDGGAVLLGTIGTMNSGLNIPEVEEVIVESIPWDYATLMQFIFRAVRANAKVPTTAHLLAVNNTFDINLMAMVASKMKQTEFSSSGYVDIDDDILSSLDINKTYLEKTKSYDFN